MDGWGTEQHRPVDDDDTRNTLNTTTCEQIAHLNKTTTTTFRCFIIHGQLDCFAWSAFALLAAALFGDTVAGMINLTQCRTLAVQLTAMQGRNFVLISQVVHLLCSAHPSPFLTLSLGPFKCNMLVVVVGFYLSTSIIQMGGQVHFRVKTKIKHFPCIGIH